MVASKISQHSKKITRIGVINIMPKAEEYEQLITHAFSDVGYPISLQWIRLDSHAYSSSDPVRIQSGYRSYEDIAVNDGLDGLVLTGAPVEEKEFEDVRYWDELERILTHARAKGIFILGLCWGGMALAKLLGIKKQRLSQKLFGVYPLQALPRDTHIIHSKQSILMCPQSRHAEIADSELERAKDAGLVRLRAWSKETGYTIFETLDRQLVMHLGHPEYTPDRLIFEYTRDLAKERAGVVAPINLSLTHPDDSWRNHRRNFFKQWVESIRQHAQQPHQSIIRKVA